MVAGLRLWGVLLLTVAATSVAGQAGDGPAESLTEFAPGWIEETLETVRIPGVIMTLVIDSRGVMARGFGLENVAEGRPATGDSRFRVGSVSKPVTATSSLIAMARNGIMADHDLRDLLSELPIDPALREPLTFHHLLTQTGGFSESLFGQHVRAPRDFLPLGDYLALHLPPRFTRPGHMISYNDHHTALAGYAVELLESRPFHAAARDILFAPLGMVRTSFDQHALHAAAGDAAIATSYRLDRGAFVPYAPDLIMTAPAAGLITTASDMGRYMEHLLARGGDMPLMPRELYDRQLSVQFRHRAPFAGRAYGFAERRQGPTVVLFKDGQASGFAARMVLVPDVGLGVFVAINRSILGPMGATNDASRFLKDYTAAIVDRALPPGQEGEAAKDRAPKPLAGVPSEFAAGIYRTTVAARHSWEKILSSMETVTISSLPGGAISAGGGPYVPVGENLYQWHEGGPYYLAFLRSEERPDEGARERADDASPASYLLAGTASYERVPWFGGHEGTNVLVSFFFLVAVGALVAGAGAWRLHRLVPWNRGAISAAALRLLFFVLFGLTLFLTDPQDLFYGMPLGIGVALALPVLAMGADLWAVRDFVGADRGGTFAHVLALVHVTGAMTFPAWLAYWNLLAWHTG